MNGECVDKCDPTGESCSWTFPGHQSECPVIDNNSDWRCEPGVEGLTCFWYVEETLHSNSAKCAACASDCKHWAGNCVKLAARICKLRFFIGCICSEVDNPPTSLKGDYYECN